MLDKHLRTLKDQALAPIAAPMGALHPTTITVVALLVGVAAGVAGAAQLYGLGLTLWLLNRLLDGLDGIVARQHNRQSDFGGYLDTLLDHITYSAVVVGLAWGAGTTAALWALATLLASFYINGASWMYLTALLEKRGQGARTSGEATSVTMPTALMEGTETVVLYALFFVLPGLLVPLYALMAALVFITVVQRLLWAQKALA